MEDYIACEKRGNHAWIHVKICQCRCEQSENCRAFQEYMKEHTVDTMTVSPEPRVWSAKKTLFPVIP